MKDVETVEAILMTDITMNKEAVEADIPEIMTMMTIMRNVIQADDAVEVQWF